MRLAKVRLRRVGASGKLLVKSQLNFWRRSSQQMKTVMMMMIREEETSRSVMIVQRVVIQIFTS